MLGMTLRFAAALAAAAVGAEHAGAIPPPPIQIAADCDSPTYASDALVCSDPALLALDRRVRDAWFAGETSSAILQGSLVEAQDAWFRRRSLCAFSVRHAACLRAAYAERITVLDAVRLVASGQPETGKGATCFGAPWGEGPVHIHAPDPAAAIVADAGGRLLAVATAVDRRDDWVPFVRFVNEADAIRFEPRGQANIVCLPMPK